MTKLFEPMSLTRGPAWKNRFMLAPLTNLQSGVDGVMSEDEFRWLTKRATGGFGLVMTCAAHVQREGQGFPGQMGVWSDAHLPGLTRMAAKIREEGAVSSLQLHHAGMRSPEAIIGVRPVAPSDNEETGSRGLTLAETEQLIEDFVEAAVRSEKAGFDGVEIHGAHGYILCQYLSAEINHRTDRYGGDIEGRSRIIFEIIDGIRARCRPDFQVGLRLSPERFGMDLMEIVGVCRRLMAEDKIDYLDMSLWDVFKEPSEEAFKGRELMSYFTELPRGNVRLGAAGKIMTGAQCAERLAEGLDFVVIGRGAILHHDFPKKVAANPDFHSRPLPVSADVLRAEGLGEAFVGYMRGWAGFVEPETAT
ncbi:MAG: NADH:flavin oxidoreductase [Caulobacteraceae bacterium]